MAAYAAYRWERETWSEYQTIMLDIKEQKKYLKKLSRHFKVPPVALRTYGTTSPYTGWFRWGWWGCSVFLGSVTAMGTLIHEFAHHLTRERWGDGNHHNKKFKRELKRCYTFAKRWLELAPEEVGSNLPTDDPKSDVTEKREPPPLLTEGSKE